MRKCGFIDCQREVWKEIRGVDSCWGCQGRTKEITCDIHSNKHWASCYHDITDSKKVAKEAASVRKGFIYQKEVLQKFINHPQISQELQLKICPFLAELIKLEGLIPELEKLTREYKEKEQVLNKEFLEEKGGKQINIYEFYFCEDCRQEIIKRGQLTKNYEQQRNKLSILGKDDFKEIDQQIRQAIGHKETDKIYWTTCSHITEEEYEENYKKMEAHAERIRKIKENEKRGLTTNFATSPVTQQGNPKQGWLILGIVSGLIILSVIGVIIYQQIGKPSKNK